MPSSPKREGGDSESKSKKESKKKSKDIRNSSSSKRSKSHSVTDDHDVDGQKRGRSRTVIPKTQNDQTQQAAALPLNAANDSEDQNSIRSQSSGFHERRLAREKKEKKMQKKIEKMHEKLIKARKIFDTAYEKGEVSEEAATKFTSAADTLSSKMEFQIPGSKSESGEKSKRSSSRKSKSKSKSSKKDGRESSKSQKRSKSATRNSEQKTSMNMNQSEQTQSSAAENVAMPTVTNQQYYEYNNYTKDITLTTNSNNNLNELNNNSNDPMSVQNQKYAIQMGYPVFESNTHTQDFIVAAQAQAPQVQDNHINVSSELQYMNQQQSASQNFGTLSSLVPLQAQYTTDNQHEYRRIDNLNQNHYPLNYQNHYESKSSSATIINNETQLMQTQNNFNYGQQNFNHLAIHQNSNQALQQYFNGPSTYNTISPQPLPGAQLNSGNSFDHTTQTMINTSYLANPNNTPFGAPQAFSSESSCNNGQTQSHSIVTPNLNNNSNSYTDYGNLIHSDTNSLNGINNFMNNQQQHDYNRSISAMVTGQCGTNPNVNSENVQANKIIESRSSSRPTVPNGNIVQDHPLKKESTQQNKPIKLSTTPFSQSISDKVRMSVTAKKESTYDHDAKQDIDSDDDSNENVNESSTEQSSINNMINNNENNSTDANGIHNISKTSKKNKNGSDTTDSTVPYTFFSPLSYLGVNTYKVHTKMKKHFDLDSTDLSLNRIGNYMEKIQNKTVDTVDKIKGRVFGNVSDTSENSRSSNSSIYIGTSRLDPAIYKGRSRENSNTTPNSTGTFIRNKKTVNSIRSSAAEASYDDYESDDIIRMSAAESPAPRQSTQIRSNFQDMWEDEDEKDDGKRSRNYGTTQYGNIDPNGYAAHPGIPDPNVGRDNYYRGSYRDPHAYGGPGGDDEGHILKVMMILIIGICLTGYGLYISIMGRQPELPYDGNGVPLSQAAQHPPGVPAVPVAGSGAAPVPGQPPVLSPGQPPVASIPPVPVPAQTPAPPPLPAAAAAAVPPPPQAVTPVAAPAQPAAQPAQPTIIMLSGASTATTTPAPGWFGMR